MPTIKRKQERTRKPLKRRCKGGEPQAEKDESDIEFIGEVRREDRKPLDTIIISSESEDEPPGSDIKVSPPPTDDAVVENNISDEEYFSLDEDDSVTETIPKEIPPQQRNLREEGHQESLAGSFIVTPIVNDPTTSECCCVLCKYTKIPCFKRVLFAALAAINYNVDKVETEEKEKTKSTLPS